METREYKCSFGNVIVTIDGNNCNGSYQTNGQFNGTIDGDIVKAKWTNDGKEGLIELDLSNNKLEGKWKQGLDEGPMRGRWEGVLIEDLNTDDSNPFDSGLEDDPFGPSTEDDDNQLSNAFDSNELIYNLFISGDANNRDNEISDELVSSICYWATSNGVERDDIIINKVFDAEEYNSFCELFIPLPADISGVLPSLLKTLYPLKECNYWIYWHEDGVNTSEINLKGDPNWDLDSQDNLFVDTSDPDSTEGDGYLAEVFSEIKDDGAKSKTETLKISFNQEYEHLLPHEITLYTKAISRSDLKNINQTAFDEYLEEFEENRSSFAFADCDDFTDVLSSDLKANEINTLISNGDVTNNLSNIVKSKDDSSDYQLVFFYIYEECDWEEMICDVETEELSKIWYKINWEILGQLKYIDSIDIMSDEDGDVLNTIYPCTDGASPGNKYDGKTFVMVTDGQDNILINATEVDGLDLSEFNNL